VQSVGVKLNVIKLKVYLDARGKVCILFGMDTLTQLAERVESNGYWSTTAIKQGRKWLKADLGLLDTYIVGLGIKQDTEGFYSARYELKQQVEWLISGSI